MFLGCGLLGVQGFRVQVGIPGFRDSCSCGLGFRLEFDVVDVRSVGLCLSHNPNPTTTTSQTHKHRHTPPLPKHFAMDPQLTLIPPPLSQKNRSLFLHWNSHI